MATTVPKDPSPAPDFLTPRQSVTDSDMSVPPEQGLAGRWLVRGGLAIVAVAILAVASILLAGTLAPEEDSKMLTHVVANGDLLVTVTEDGNLESAVNKEYKCEIEGGSTILFIVEDGKNVKKGEIVVELDSSTIDLNIRAQRILYEKAVATHIQAKETFEAARVAFDEYEMGLFVQALETADANITIAKAALNSAVLNREFGKRMFRKGYIPKLDLQAREEMVKRAELDLKVAGTARKTLVDYTKAKTLAELRAARDSAKALVTAETVSLEAEEARLNLYKAQLKKSVIRAGTDGMVVYANEQSRHSNQAIQIEEGTPVRERQNILRVPDLSQMQVKVMVHESKIDQLRLGMPARIRIQGDEYQGTVIKMANQAEQSSWFSPDVKQYATTVKINGQPEGLKPGMTAEVSILVDHVRDSLTIPVAAVVEQRGNFVCWVKSSESPEGAERRPLVLGLSDDKFIVVKDGVADGEEVLLNPRAVVKEARIEDQMAEAVDVEKQFGKMQSGLAGGREGPPAGRRHSGGAAGGGSPGGPRGRAAANRGGGNLFQHDKDGDGKISRSEAPERMKSFFDRIDTNSDGMIDAAEVKTRASRRRNAGPDAGAGAN